MALIPTLFSEMFVLMTGPKHSTSVPFSVEVAVPLSVDENEVAFVPGPNPYTRAAVKARLPSVGPQ